MTVDPFQTLDGRRPGSGLVVDAGERPSRRPGPDQRVESDAGQVEIRCVEGRLRRSRVGTWPARKSSNRSVVSFSTRPGSAARLGSMRPAPMSSGVAGNSGTEVVFGDVRIAPWSSAPTSARSDRDPTVGEEESGRAGGVGYRRRRADRTGGRGRASTTRTRHPAPRDVRGLGGDDVDARGQQVGLENVERTGHRAPGREARHDVTGGGRCHRPGGELDHGVAGGLDEVADRQAFIGIDDERGEPDVDGVPERSRPLVEDGAGGTEFEQDRAG